MAKSSTELLPLDWELLRAEGPAVACHVGCVIGNDLYIHGGITKYGDNTPSNKLYCFNLTSKSWSEITKSGAPALSHHACVAIENRFMILIGGWNGRQRISSVHVFDCQEQTWLAATDSGFPDGAGLSSHCALVLSTGDILIIGREGSLRTQRKHGNAYVLTGSPLSGQFHYRKMTNSTASRSGHTINTVGNHVYIIGGRDDQLIEFHSGYRSNESLSALSSQISDIAEKLKPLSKPPCGRKNHISFTGKGCLVIHGGETFDGRSREPVGELYIVTVKPNLTYYKVGNTSVPRACHVCVSNGDRVIIHGGIAGRNVVYGDTYELKIRK